MWEIIVEIGFDKLTSVGIEAATRMERIDSPGGQIPSREEIGDIARERFAEFSERLHETMGNRPYEYGDFRYYRIKSVTWVPQ